MTLGDYYNAELLLKKAIHLFPDDARPWIAFVKLAEFQRNFNLMNKRINIIQKKFPNCKCNFIHDNIYKTRILKNNFFVDKKILNFKSIICTRYYIHEFKCSNFIKMKLNSYNAITQYLDERNIIFKNNCYNSVLENMGKNDTWLLLVSDEFSDYVKKSLKNLDKRIKIVNINQYKNFLNYEINNHNSYILTTRIDNDDSLSCDYINTVKESISRINKDYGIIIFPYGLKYNKIFGLSPFLDTTPHFLTMFTNKKNISHIDLFSHINHAKIFEIDYPVFTINTSLPMWCEHIHTTNQKNSINSYCTINEYKSLLKNRFLCKTD